MREILNLNEQNKVAVMLMQALWGAVSPNFRMIALSLSEPVWQLLFVLAEESEADRDEIEDVAGEFDALLLGIETKDVKFDVQIIVNADPLPMLDMASWRMVFRRKEI